jgi:hypothetical protein
LDLAPGKISIEINNVQRSVDPDTYITLNKAQLRNLLAKVAQPTHLPMSFLFLVASVYMQKGPPSPGLPVSVRRLKLPEYSDHFLYIK